MDFPPHEIVKDLAQEAAWLVAVVGGLIAAFKALHEMRSSTEQRRLELRWRRAKAAKELLHEIHDSLMAYNAITMLDWEAGKHTYKDKKDGAHTVSFAQVLPALSCNQCDSISDSDQFIRDCFDWFFYYIDQVEHHIRTGYIDFIDVETAFRPYVRKMRVSLNAFSSFAAYREYDLVIPFLDRYPQRPNPVPVTD